MNYLIRSYHRVVLSILFVRAVFLSLLLQGRQVIRATQLSAYKIYTEDLRKGWTQICKMYMENNNHANCWIPYDFNIKETRPKKPGRYIVHRKDGKMHLEVWNGMGWAYNGNVITFYMNLTPPSNRSDEDRMKDLRANAELP